MIGAINKVYGKTWNLDGVTYENGVFTFTPGILAMSTCAMPNPIAGHLYYGSVEQKAPAGSSFPDRRFEWWVGDEVGNVMTFAYMDGTNDQWVRQSSVLKVDAVVKDGWIMRNFTVNGTAEAYRRNPIIIDLTAAFGAGNEPTAAWVDANMILSPNGDTIFFDVPSAENAVEDRRRMMLAGGKKFFITSTRSDTTGGKYLDYASANVDGIDISSAGTYEFKKGSVVNCIVKSGRTSNTAYITFNGSRKASVTGSSDTATTSWSFVLESDAKINFKVSYQGGAPYGSTSWGIITLTTI